MTVRERATTHRAPSASAGPLTGRLRSLARISPNVRRDMIAHADIELRRILRTSFLGAAPGIESC